MAEATRVFIGLGSNIDPERHLDTAVRRIAERTEAVALSPVYRTAAIGRPGQDDFLNAVVLVRCLMTPRELKFELLRPIEGELDRSRDADAYAPRTIDLDILLHGEAVCSEPDLRLPDPDIVTRPFLARGLLDIDAALTMPGSGSALAELAPEGTTQLAPWEPYSSELLGRFALLRAAR